MTPFRQGPAQKADDQGPRRPLSPGGQEVTHSTADQSEAIKALEARLESLVVDVSPRGGGR
jgi:hypothetical protein